MSESQIVFFSSPCPNRPEWHGCYLDRPVRRYPTKYRAAQHGREICSHRAVGRSCHCGAAGIALMDWTPWLQMRVSTCEAQADALGLLSLAQEKTAFNPSGSQSVDPTSPFNLRGDGQGKPLHERAGQRAANCMVLPARRVCHFRDRRASLALKHRDQRRQFRVRPGPPRLVGRYGRHNRLLGRASGLLSGSRRSATSLADRRHSDRRETFGRDDSHQSFAVFAIALSRRHVSSPRPEARTTVQPSGRLPDQPQSTSTSSSDRRKRSPTSMRWPISTIFPQSSSNSSCTGTIRRILTDIPAARNACSASYTNCFGSMCRPRPS